MDDAPSAGWYSDPDLPKMQRYWDGGRWTEHRAPGQQRDSDKETVVALLVGVIFVIGLVFVLALAL